MEDKEKKPAKRKQKPKTLGPITIGSLFGGMFGMDSYGHVEITAENVKIRIPVKPEEASE